MDTVPPAHTGPSILIIEDDQAFVFSVTRLLSGRGYHVLAASDGRAALDLAATSRPDLILCDVELPTIDGYEVLRLLRQNQEIAHIPVILLTGRSDKRDVRAGMNLGADDYLTKPVSAADLLQSVQARIERRRFHEKRAQRRAEPVAQPVPSQTGDPGTPEANALTDQPAQSNRSVLVRTAAGSRVVQVHQITHLTADGEYSRVFWVEGKGVMVRKSLKSWAAELPASLFIRVHRNTLVNAAYVESVYSPGGGRLALGLRGRPEPIQVSLRLAARVKRLLKKYVESHPA